MGRNLMAWVSKTCGHRQADPPCRPFRSSERPGGPRRTGKPTIPGLVPTFRGPKHHEPARPPCPQSSGTCRPGLAARRKAGQRKAGQRTERGTESGTGDGKRDRGRKAGQGTESGTESGTKGDGKRDRGDGKRDRGRKAGQGTESGTGTKRDAGTKRDGRYEAGRRWGVFGLWFGDATYSAGRSWWNGFSRLASRRGANAVVRESGRLPSIRAGFAGYT